MTDDRTTATAALATTAALVATATAVFTAAGVLSAAQSWGSSEATLPGPVLVAWLVLILLLGASAWLIRTDRPVAAIGLATAALTVQLGLWGGWPWVPAVIQVAGPAARWLTCASLAQVALRWTGPSRSLPFVWALTGGAGLMQALAHNPLTDVRCARVCRDIQVPLDGRLPPALIAWVCVGLASAAMLLAGREIQTGASGAPRLLRGVVVLACGGALLIAASPLIAWAYSNPHGDVAMLALAPVTAVALAVAWLRLQGHRVQSAVRGLVADLVAIDETDPKGHRANAVFRPPGGQWIDEIGRPVLPPAQGSPAWDFVGTSGTPTRVALTGLPPDAVVELSPGLRMALANARLGAQSRAHARELREAQRRAVASADAERRRIERDLHDGAQQRLVSASMHLGLARVRGAADPEVIDPAMAGLHAALEGLRRISHGPFPEVLVEVGLHAALRDLIDDCPISTRLAVEVRGDEAPESARAVFALVQGVLEAASGQPRPSAPASSTPEAEVIVSRQGQSLKVVARAPVQLHEVDLTAVADRVGALGGTLHMRPAGQLTQVTAVIPCAS